MLAKDPESGFPSAFVASPTEPQEAPTEAVSWRRNTRKQ